MIPNEITDIIDDWNQQADSYDRDGALVDGAAVLRRCSNELRAALETWWTQPLSPEEAAAECPWKTGTIRRKIGDVFPDAGEPYRPRVRRCDLYAAFTDTPDSPEIDGPDPAEEVLAGLEEA